MRKENQLVTEKAKFEPHYSPAELAKTWGLRTKLICELFCDEKGVLPVDRPAATHKRGNATMRIPHSVAERVYARLTHRARPVLVISRREKEV